MGEPGTFYKGKPGTAYTVVGTSYPEKTEPGLQEN